MKQRNDKQILKSIYRALARIEAWQGRRSSAGPKRRSKKPKSQKAKGKRQKRK